MDEELRQYEKRVRQELDNFIERKEKEGYFVMAQELSWQEDLVCNLLSNHLDFLEWKREILYGSN